MHNSKRRLTATGNICSPTVWCDGKAVPDMKDQETCIFAPAAQAALLRSRA